MPIDTLTLIWLFPAAFMLHDFEEIIFSEAWQRKNAEEIKRRIRKSVPAFLAEQMCAALDKPTAELALPISLIFLMTILSTYLAAVYGKMDFFLLASGLFFLHGFMHLGQAILLRRYIPAVITSVVIAIPYGLVLFSRLIGEGIVDISRLLIYLPIVLVLGIPFILVMHVVGDYLYKKISVILVD